MGFEKTIGEYREAKQELAGSSAEEMEFIRANALQKAWADRMSESIAGDENKRDDAAFDAMSALGDWFREQVLSVPERQKHYLDLFDVDPDRAVKELSELYRSMLH